LAFCQQSKFIVNFLFFLAHFLIYWVVFFGAIVVRYFLIAGGIYWLFYLLAGKYGARVRSCVAIAELPKQWLLWKSIRKDIELSVVSAAIFALSSAFVTLEYGLGNTLLYTSLDLYSLWYLGSSLAAVLVLQDTYFYFFHRLFHHPRLFKWLHYGHHRCKNPTPWTSFAFDPLEALIQSFFYIGIVFIVPLHFITVVCLFTIATVWAVINHLGFKLFPASPVYQWFGRWFVGPINHSLHHQKYTINYGLYFTFWDNLLGTNHHN
jgi:sterol desaturase/sphingolipid hydroxylase (fatty acid hydroxylase superfamily)